MGPGTRSLLPSRLRATRTDLTRGPKARPVPDPTPAPARGTGARPSDIGPAGLTSPGRQDQKRR